MSKFPYVLSGRNLMYQEMDQNVILLLPVLIPIAAGILLLTVKRLRSSRKAMLCLVVAALTAGALCAFAAVASGGGLTLWRLTDTITIEFRDQQAFCRADGGGLASGRDLFHNLYDP